MIFVETSALVALMLKEPDAPRILNALLGADKKMTGSHVRVEACMVVSSRLNLAAEAVNERMSVLFREMNIAVAPLTDEIASIAVRAFDAYGKGKKNKAQLNLADCMSYAFAKSHKLDILFTGQDFCHTDLKAA